MVAGVGPAQDWGGHPVTGGGELGSLALTPPIRVSILTIIIFGNNNINNNNLCSSPYKLLSMVKSSQSCQSPGGCSKYLSHFCKPKREHSTPFSLIFGENIILIDAL